MRCFRTNCECLKKAIPLGNTFNNNNKENGAIINAKNKCNLWGLRDEEPANKWRNPFKCCYQMCRARKVENCDNLPTPVLSITVLSNNLDDLVKDPSPHSTPEKSQSGSRRRSPSSSQRHRNNAHTFSSGSESSGYFTPPPDQDLEANGRFVRVSSSIKINDPRLENNAESFKLNETLPNVVQKDPFGSLNSINYVERTLTRNETTNSLQEISKVRLNNDDTAKKVMSAQVTITTAVHSASRKNINSAPTLNESITIFTPEEKDPPATDIPDTNTKDIVLLESDSLEDVTEVPPQLVSFTTSPEKKVLLAKAALRRKASSSKLNSGSKCGHDSSYNSDRPFPKPREAFFDLTAQLECPEWEVTIKGLHALGRLIKYHKDIVENHMHAICVLLGKHVRNLRSQVARNGCLVATQLFQIENKKALEMELDEIATPLLHRTADTNKFLRSDANNALDQMCNNLSIPKVVSLIAFRGCQHQNAVVRSTSARLLSSIAQRLGAEKVFQLPRDTRDKLLLAGANGLTEGSLDTRQHSKLLLATLSSHSQFQRAMSEAVPANVLRHINKTLKTLIK